MIRLGYILSASHSGSTLLAMLLGAHPVIATMGELKMTPSSLGDINKYRCSCQRAILECPFWQEVHKKMAKRDIEFDVANSGTDFVCNGSTYNRYLSKAKYRGKLLEIIRNAGLWLSPSWRQYYRLAQYKNKALMENLLDITGKKVIIDSSKAAVRLKYLLRNPELDIKVIRLIRDGRAVAMTYMDPAAFADAKKEALRGGGSGGQRPDKPLSMTQAACEWKRSNEEAEYILRRLNKSQWIKVRYEELCEDTENTLKRIFEFLGVDSQSQIRDFRSVDHHIVGNGMRFDTTSEILLDERWRSILTQSDLQIFDREAGEMNRKYGYK